jgi:hypothetical protein
VDRSLTILMLTIFSSASGFVVSFLLSPRISRLLVLGLLLLGAVLLMLRRRKADAHLSRLGLGAGAAGFSCAAGSFAVRLFRPAGLNPVWALLLALCALALAAGATNGASTLRHSQDAGEGGPNASTD